jgi:hypothetical protein
MKTQTVRYCIVAILMLVSLACGLGTPAATPVPATATALPEVTATPTLVVTPTETPAEECLIGETYHPDSQICYDDSEVVLQEFLEWLQDSPAPISSNRMKYMDENFDKLVTYQVTDGEIAEPKFETGIPNDFREVSRDEDLHKKLWKYFIAMIPADQRIYINKFQIFSDGPSGILAAVIPDEKEEGKWTLAVDAMDANATIDLTYTLVHEFGHLLTLNENQVPPEQEIIKASADENERLYEKLYKEASDSCDTYFTGEGCSLPDSYIYKFFRKFWKGDVYTDFLYFDKFRDPYTYYTGWRKFYYKYEEQFVSSYASTNPVEDMAESWTSFVLKDKPGGDSIADQKVLFFYDYPELVDLRRAILARTYSRIMRMDH